MGADEQDRPARPRRAQSATERDLQGLRAREERDREHAVDIDLTDLGDDFESDSFTPIKEVLQRIGEEPGLRDLAEQVWRHTANMEMRARKRVSETSSAALKERLDKLMARMWWVASFVLGGIGGLVVKLLLVARAYGALETQVQANKDSIELMQSVLFIGSKPVVVPGKANPP